MANIVKDSSNRVYQNPTKLLFLIPIGVIIFVYLFDICFLKYNEWKLNNATEQVIINTLDHEQFISESFLKDYVKRKYEELGYKENTKLNIVVQDKYIIVDQSYSFFSLRGYIFSKNAHASTVMIGYYDDYKNPVAEKYKDNQEKPKSNYYIFENKDVTIE